MSPDGGRIAYQWWVGDEEYELRVVAAGGGEERVIVPRTANHYSLRTPLEWSADGSQILCLMEQVNGHWVDLALIPADGGAPKLLHSFPEEDPGHVSLSPDGRFVAYDFPRHSGSVTGTQLIILPTDGSPPRSLIDGSANDGSPLWTPDSAQIFFTSDRSGESDGWIVDVSDGVSRGQPRLVSRNMEFARPVALTSDGRYHYRLDTSALHVYVVPVDLAGGSPQGKSVRFPLGAVAAYSLPGWSPDFRFLAYLTGPSSPGPPVIRDASGITIVDTLSGTRRDIVPQLSALRDRLPLWSPSGDSIFVKGTSLENRTGYFRVDVVSGETAPVMFLDSPDRYSAFRWSVDGRALLYMDAERGIVAHDLASGREAIVVDWKANKFLGFFGFAASPDGHSLAFGAQGAGSFAPAVFAQAFGGAPIDLFRLGSSEPGNRKLLNVLAWTPDNQEILFATLKFGLAVGSDVPYQLWRVPAAGGEPQNVGVRIPGFAPPYATSLSPDLKFVAYSVVERADEMWVMEQFLPPRGSEIFRPRR
ncbi:MAG: PD40 domain-containing protein [Acidobacteria bacterium]|nr:PD40 domain-containing protein [Acidobacteriota bacterium]